MLYPDEKRDQQPGRDVTERFANAFWRINRQLRSGAMAQGGHQVTRLQWQILRYVRHKEGCTIGQLAAHMDVRPSTMSQMLDRLEKQNWVVRTQSTQDSRVRQIALTDEGRALMHTVEMLRQDSLSPALQTLTAQEQETLIDLLTRVAQAL
ncbi:MAG: MarR family transcriptional regulator [Firmicutes bacterium]|nr:MarR family transcriptional regulator [Bacillota bacterium]